MNGWVLTFSLHDDGSISNGRLIDNNGFYRNQGLCFSSVQEAENYLKVHAL